jgi:hypothetical protein
MNISIIDEELNMRFTPMLVQEAVHWDLNYIFQMTRLNNSTFIAHQDAGRQPGLACPDT